MRVFRMAALAVAAGLVSLAAPASAQTDVDVAFNVGVVSDYVFRGASQTDEEPAIQGGVDITAGSFYAGVWGSNVDFFDDLGSPGGAAKLGVIDKDHPLIEALPPQEHDE